MAAHAEFSPSGAYRWCKDACPGTIAISKGRPSVSGPAAMEGTRAHKWLEIKIRRLLLGENLSIPLGLRLKKESLSAVEHALRYIKTAVARGMKILDVESLVTVSSDVWGTCDLRGYHPAQRCLYVIEYKNGRIPVAIEDNLQLQTYAWGTVLHPSLGWDWVKPESVEMVIIQPNSNDGKVFKSQTKSLAQLYDFSVYLEESVKAAKNPHALRKPGHWCYWCTGKEICPEYLMYVEEDKTSIKPEIQQLMTQYAQLINK